MQQKIISVFSIDQLLMLIVVLQRIVRFNLSKWMTHGTAVHFSLTDFLREYNFKWI